MLFPLFKHMHSGLRWFVLLAILVAIANALINFIKQKELGAKDRKINLIALALMHTQLSLGLVLYFISPFVKFKAESMSDPLLRFYLVEHLSMMFLAATLITVGYIKSKRSFKPSSRHRAVLIFYTLALLVIYLGIPWPWRDLGGSWF